MKSSAVKKRPKRETHIEEALLIIIRYLEADILHHEPRVEAVKEKLAAIVRGAK